MKRVNNPSELMIIIIGSTCAGKTTVENKIISELGFLPVNIYATREKRDDDPDHYHFVERDSAGDYLMTINTGDGQQYSYVKQEGSVKNCVSFINADDAGMFEKKVHEDNPTTNIVSLLLDVSDVDVQKCLDERGFSEEEYQVRMDAFNQSSYVADFVVTRDDIFEIIESIDNEFEDMYTMGSRI